MENFKRNRRLLQNGWIRDLLQENHINASDLIQPIFLFNNTGKQEIKGLTGQFRFGVEEALKEISELQNLGIKAIAIFPYIDQELKDDNGSYALSPNNFLYNHITKIKAEFPDMGLICDVALDPYTSHGHDGILGKNGDVDNNQTIKLLAEQALMLANAGADIIAPSDMMDGRVQLIREVLDKNHHQNKVICSYAAKFASAFYGPFREAVGSDNNIGKADKKTYQLNPANIKNALNKTASDIGEGADMVIVKPAGNYLDVISKVKEEFNLTTLAYQVSGEFEMLKQAAKAGVIDFEQAYSESLIAIKRAGADAIITYGAKEFLENS